MKIENSFVVLAAVLFAAFAASVGYGQSRTNTLSRPCPGSTTPAIVEIKRTGDVNIRPCSGKTLQQNGTSINIAQPFELIVAATDEVTTITLANAVVTFHVPRAFTATQIWVGLTTVSSSGLVTVDINKNGVSIFTTKITVDASEETSLTAAVAAALLTTTFVQGDKITVDIDGAGTGSVGLKVYFIGTR